MYLFTYRVKPTYNALCLKNVALFIEPDVVQYKDKSTLRCTYDLEDDVLYSVKWYRGSREFYRYIPAEQPSIKFFPIPGVTADVSAPLERPY
ncbi:hypothetical protein GWI33_010895 [Rhynchophorus ferrugineus]|uniref:Beat protein n=1 Tax=Rhynchophorus ferrugineus TaxID=354439 RepID=A0A834I8Y4_RHYFE|nr:hypothetical protein GWI33_010895 [Rhynchophorus ferrugineus]